MSEPGAASSGAPPRPRNTLRRIVMAFALAAKAAPGALLLYVALTLAAGTIPVMTAWLTKSVLDGLARGAASATLVALSGGLAAAGLAAGVMPQATQYLRAEMDRRAGLLAQERLFTAVDGFVGLERLENPRFLDQLRLAQHAGGAMPLQAVDAVLGISRAGITITGFLGSLFLLNPSMTVLLLISGVPTLIAEAWLSRRRSRMLWNIGPTERREFFYNTLLSSIEAAKEVRLFGLGAFFRQRMLDDRRTANTAKRVLDRRECAVQGGLGLLAAAVSGAGLLWAVHAAASGRLSVGDVTIFVAAVAGVQSALSTVATETSRAHHALLMFDHYVAVTEAGPDLPVATAPCALPPLRHGIEFRDVWFRYSDEHPWVLRGVNLRIAHGTALALVGLNGAGKSTLVKLVCRFYDPTQGSILWDGIDIRDVDVADLRQRIGVVFQDYMEYDMPAAENIALGDLAAIGDRERIQTAARRAGIHDTITELPDGYDTLLSRMFFMESDRDDPKAGVVLSGGQWQRIALARAFLRDQHELMILDEPSSGLDAAAEHEIHTSLRRHRDGRTSLLVSHRLSAVRDADLIVVLLDGRIAEQGDHMKLMAAGGQYARLFTLQASGYQLSAPDTSALTGMS